MSHAPPEFSGFPPALFDFLAELSANNERDWFEKNKARYEEYVRGPALAFVRAMAPHLAAVTPHLIGDDRKMGGSLMRIYRDTRFSADKTPYKTNVGIQFRHGAGKDVHGPGLYLHLDLEETFVGVGMWRPEKDALAAIRQRIADEPDRWRGITEDPVFAATFRQGGESLKRVPRGFDKDHPLVEELKRTSFILMHDLPPEAAESAELPHTLGTLLNTAAPYCRFLCQAIGLPF